MKYSFDKQIDRRTTNSLKWDVPDNVLPMWVADMDFETAPEIIEALRKRTEHGAFGYGVVTEEWKEAICAWWEKHHHIKFEKDWLIFSTGVVPTLSSMVRKLTTPNEKVLIQTPVYNIFFNSIVNNGARVSESPLVYKNHQYSIDFEDLERKLADPQTTLMILCNPHNPIGKIWDKETLARIGELCSIYHVVVISDEIHCDLTDPEKEYVPFASVSQVCRDNSITCIAPTKAFNLAGLQTSAVVVSNPYLHHKVYRALNTDEVAEPNAYAIDGAVAAFTKGEPWLKELRAYLYENKKYVKNYIEQEIPEISLVSSEATYLLWLDCSRFTEDSEMLCDYLYKKQGLYLSEGSQYGACGRAFVRLNIACPRKTLEEGMQRFRQGCIEFQKSAFL